MTSLVARRQVLQAALSVVALATILGVAQVAVAGSYLNRAGMLLSGAELEARALRARFMDKDLARLTHRLALARLQSAGEMPVPADVKRAHPHLLLALESFERAADAAVRGNQSDFLVALGRAREESRILEALLKQEGWELPKEGAKGTASSRI
jgi:hypothetical protein